MNGYQIKVLMAKTERSGRQAGKGSIPNRQVNRWSKGNRYLNGMKVVHDNTCVDYRCAYSSQGTMEVGWGWTDILKSSEYLNFFTG